MEKHIIFLFLFFLISCNKEEKPKEQPKDLPIEEYIYDSTGVVFKIVNDVDSIFNFLEKIYYDEEVYPGTGPYNYPKLMLKVDSLALEKFQYYKNGDSLTEKEYFTWIKRGEYVCWRYKYIGEDKRVAIGYFNPYHSQKPYGPFGLGEGLCYCCQLCVQTDRFQQVFPYPVNDTVYVKISSILKFLRWPEHTK